MTTTTPAEIAAPNPAPVPAYCAGHWGDIYCPNAPVCTMTFQCPCGHTAADHACRECEDWTLRLIAAGNFICTVCEDGPDAHICPVTIWEG